jgi:hypothetical protein
MYFGDLETFVASNTAPFQAGGAAVRCARALGEALVAGAIQTYDPNEMRRMDELDAEIGAMGISPGARQAPMSAQLYSMGRDLGWLAEVLPSAASGNYGPYRNPTSYERQMVAFGWEMFRVMLQDPEILAVMEPLTMAQDLAN